LDTSNAGSGSLEASKMCINVEHVIGTLEQIALRLSQAQDLMQQPNDDEKSLKAAKAFAKEAILLFQALELHMRYVLTSEDEIDWDALLHSLMWKQSTSE